MPTRDLAIKHLFAGGWAPDLGPYSAVAPDQGGIVQVPHLVNAENIVFEADGGIRKMPGIARINGTVFSGTVVAGCYDFWLQGTAGAPAQHRIVHAGTEVLKDDADGTFTAIFTGMESGAIPSYSTFDDILIISSTSTSDVPKSWDGTTAQDLAGSPPNFAFSATHKNRSWAAGVVTAPSTLYYSNNVDPEDWSGGGNIQIDPNDGDMITGIASHKNELWVFKGPYKGSIHRITGSSPSDFARTTFVDGVGTVWHNSIFKFGDDLGFIWSDGSVRSLSATAAFGDYNEVALSRPLQGWLRDNLNFTRLKYAWAANVASEGFVIFTFTGSGASQNNVTLIMDYRFNPVRWAYWTDVSIASVAPMNDPNQAARPIVMAGSNDGYLLRLLRPTRNINTSTAITAKVTLPALDYGSLFTTKVLAGIMLGLRPKNNNNITFRWTRDENTQQSANISQSSAVVLGVFVLGTDKLAGDTFVPRPYDATTGGEFRAITFEFEDATLDSDLQIHSLNARIKPQGIDMEP